jgi:hypothetical protein
VAVSWPDEVDEVLDGDLTAGLAYVTPAGGTVVTAVAPIGLRDREAGAVTFTTSLGFGRKLERIRREPRVALGYHAREHGFSTSPLYVLVQGRAEFTTTPDRAYIDDVVAPQAERHLGPRKRGRLFWDRWLREYYAERVPVIVTVERVTTWPDLRCGGEPAVIGAPAAPQPAAQSRPAKGTGPRVDSRRAAARLRRLPDRLLGFVDGDGYPTIVPVEVAEGGEAGIELSAEPGLIPPGGRRAGLLGHEYRPQLIGLEARQHTGWLDRAGESTVYAPHTEAGFRAPPNKTLLLFFNGLLAKRGLRQARRAGATSGG